MAKKTFMAVAVASSCCIALCPLVLLLLASRAQTLITPDASWLPTQSVANNLSGNILSACCPLLLDLLIECRPWPPAWKSDVTLAAVMLLAMAVTNLCVTCSNFMGVTDEIFLHFFFAISMVCDNAVAIAFLFFFNETNSTESLSQLTTAGAIVTNISNMIHSFCFFSGIMSYWAVPLHICNAALELLVLGQYAVLMLPELKPVRPYGMGILTLLISSAFVYRPGLLTLIPVARLLLAFTRTTFVFIWMKLHQRDEFVNARDALLAKAQFTRYIAHEMRTPLNVTTIGVGLVMEALKAGAHLKKACEIDIFEVWDRLNDVASGLEDTMDTLNEFLLFDKIQSGSFVLDKEIISIKPLIFLVFRSFFPQAQEKSITFVLKCTSSIDNLKLNADKKKMAQSMRNFISNALKFTPVGGTVTVKAYLSPGACEEHNARSAMFHFLVEDSGVGIQPHHIPKLFHEVVQFDAAKLQGGGGSGLGLTITKAIISSHGGLVGVKSAVGKGSSFYFDVPIYKADTKNPIYGDIVKSPMVYDNTLSMDVDVGYNITKSVKFDQCDRSQSSTTFSDNESCTTMPSVSLRVLVVDDSPLNLKMMTKSLQQLGCVVLTADDGISGLTAMSERSYSSDPSNEGIDMVITDYHMPEMDGLELTAALRDRGYRGSITLMTGDENGGDTLMSNFYKIGGNRILLKPIRLPDLTKLLVPIQEKLANSLKTEVGSRSGIF